MYNVRCVVSGFGFAPSNTGYIGTMNAGTSASTKIDLYIIALNASKGNENGSQYGSTVGTVTLIYENENGEEFQQETTFETVVNRPIVQLQQTDNAEEEEQKAASQWWVSVLILGGVILAAALGIILVRKRQKKSRRGISVKSRQKPFCVVAGRLSSCCVWGFTCCFPAHRPPGSSIQRSRYLLS